MYLVKSLSPDKGSGRYTMYLPLSPQGICRAKRVDTLCICQTPCLERGTLPDAEKRESEIERERESERERERERERKKKHTHTHTHTHTRKRTPKTQQIFWGFCRQMTIRPSFSQALTNSGIFGHCPMKVLEFLEETVIDLSKCWESWEIWTSSNDKLSLYDKIPMNS